MSKPQTILTCLWFDTQAEQAAAFYVSLFENSRILGSSRYGKNGPMPEGTVLMITFELGGTEYMALNGGPMFPHSEAASIVVKCDNQDEIDRLWSALTANGGKESRCGWLKDRFGVSWQIVPSRIAEWMTDADPAKSARVMGAVMKMVKLDIATLETAFEGE